MTPTIHVLPALQDNYIFAIRTQSGLLVVDPAEAAPILRAFPEEPVSAVLNTHHHWDHVGANLELQKHFGCAIYAHKKDAHRIPGITHSVEENQHLNLNGIDFEILFTPGHTSGHILWFAPQLNTLFAGDTVFRAGCGRLFEGSAEDMFQSFQKIGSLPDSTLIYCAHEYTLSNLRFAASCFPDHQDIRTELNRVSNLPKPHRTIPALLAQEKQLNPFFLARDAQEFARFRENKDRF